MEGIGGNEWKFVKRTILSQLWQNNTEVLPVRLFSSLKLNPQILGCRFLNVLVLIRGFYCTCEVNRMGENSNLKCYVKAVPVCDFKLV